MVIHSGTIFHYGKRIDNSQRKHIYTFQLVPNKTGELQLPKLVFETEGRQLTAGGGTLTVKSADAQESATPKTEDKPKPDVEPKPEDSKKDK